MCQEIEILSDSINENFSRLPPQSTTRVRIIRTRFTIVDSVMSIGEDPRSPTSFNQVS